MKISVQNWIVDRKSEEEQIKMLARAGFEYVDWDFARFAGKKKAGRESEEATIAHYTHLRQISDKCNIKFWMTHTIFPTYMDEINRDEVMTRIEKCFLASNLLGARYTIVHPMMPRKWEGEANRELRVRANIAFYTSLIPLAEKYGVGICIENMFGLPCGVGKYNETACSRYDEMLAIFNGIGDKQHFSFCFDSGHANINYKDKHPEMIYALGSNIKTVHLHDNNSNFDYHSMPCTGNLNWDAVIVALQDVGFDGVYNFELAPTQLIGFNKQKKLAKIYDSLVQFLKEYE